MDKQAINQLDDAFRRRARNHKLRRGVLLTLVTVLLLALGSGWVFLV